jgi:hypothetical protein
MNSKTRAHNKMHGNMNAPDILTLFNNLLKGFKFFSNLNFNAWQIQWCNMSQILDVDLFDEFPLTLGEFWHETSVIGKVILLSLYAYVERPKQSWDAPWASIWLQTSSEPWVGLEVELGSTSNLCISSWNSIMPLMFHKASMSITWLLSTITSKGSNLFSISWMEELRNEFTCWFSWHALALVIGPCMITIWVVVSMISV